MFPEEESLAVTSITMDSVAVVEASSFIANTSGSTLTSTVVVSQRPDGSQTVYSKAEDKKVERLKLEA